MSVTTLTTADLITEATPSCDRCHRGDRHGLSTWLGLHLCTDCTLIAKARRALSA